MSTGEQADELAARAGEAIRQVLAEAEERAAGILRDAESEAATIRERAEAEASAIRERGESDARGQIEAAKRALDELGGTLAAAASSALPNAEIEPQETETEPEPEEPAESPDPPEEQVSPPADQPEPEQAAPAAGNGDDAAERLVAMKMAVDGNDQAAIDAELTEKFGPGDRSELLKEVLGRVAR